MEIKTMKRTLGLLTWLLAMVLTLASPVAAHPGHSHKVLGTVTAATADHVSLKDRDGKDVTVRVTKDTKVKAKSPMKVDEIKAGTRVVVTAIMDEKSAMTATLIEIGAAAPAPAK